MSKFLKYSPLVLSALVVLAVAIPSAHAQGGCVNSPENPTAVLALIGSAGAFTAAARARFSARRKK